MSVCLLYVYVIMQKLQIPITPSWSPPLRILQHCCKRNHNLPSYEVFETIQKCLYLTWATRWLSMCAILFFRSLYWMGIFINNFTRKCWGCGLKYLWLKWAIQRLSMCAIFIHSVTVFIIDGIFIIYIYVKVVMILYLT